MQHFARTVNLKSKPYYSVLLDATFLIAMIRMTTSNAGNESGKESTIVSRIERVLQVNNSSNSFSGFSRDERLSGVVGDSSHSTWNDTAQQNNNNNSQGRQFARYNVRYFIPQEAVDELETILKNFKDRAEQTKHRKKQRKHAEKAKVFEDALEWIKSNKSKRHSHPSSGRCEVLPKLSALVEPPSKKKKQPQESSETNDEEPAPIGASDAVRRHISRDDGREDPDTNQRIPKKQREEQGNSSFSRTYIVASQEEDLLDDLRMLGTVPILRCANNASVLILENPSKKGQRTDNAKEHSKWKGALQNPAEKALVDAAWEAQKKHKVKIMGLEAEQSNKRGQVKAKGPNPLSCKRKRTESQQQQQSKSGESKSKKRRARAQRNKEQSAAESPKE